MAGRKLDPIWMHFDKIKQVPGVAVSRAKCKKCGKELQGLTARLKAHNEKCRVQENENQDIHEVNQAQHLDLEEGIHVLSSSPSPSTSSKSVNPVPPVTICSAAEKKRKTSNPSIEQYVHRTTPAQKAALDKQIASAMFATNTAFSCIEHPEVIKAIELLRPGYSPPNRKNVSGKLLDEVYEDVQGKVNDKLNGKTVSMALDGWSNVHNEPIVCITVTTEEKVYLIKTVDTSGNSHTADYLADIAKTSIMECQKKTGCKVRSFVTDNAANVHKMRENLESDEDPELDVITYGCSAHILNLLAHDFHIADVKEHVVEIMKHFRNVHFASAKYRENGGKAFVLPQEVRWNTMADCLQSYVDNWAILIKVCEDHRDKIDSNIANKIRNVSLKRNAEDYLNRLKPVSVALDRVQRDSCTLSEAVVVWRKLLNEDLPTVCTKQLLVKAKNRQEMALTPAHLLAHLMDPKYCGKYLSVKEVNEAMEYAHTRFPGIVPTLINYKAKCAPFSHYMFSQSVLDTVSAVAWWKSFGFGEQIDRNVIDVACQLHSAVASSAGLERIFSAFGYVHSKVRNRLGTEKAAKLVTVFKALNQT